MHEFISWCVCVALTSSLPVSLSPLCVRVCVCPSHPSRAVHLYLSETSIEVDSSDGMISEASTKDPSSSEEEGPSSDDDDGGDDSDWGGGGRQRDRNTDVKSARKLAGGMPRWHPRVTVHVSAERRLDDESAAAAVSKKQAHCSRMGEKGKEVLFESFWIRNAFDRAQSFETGLKV